MNTAPTVNYEITGHEFYFSTNRAETLQNTARKLGGEWTYDFIKYALICNYEEIIAATGEEIKVGFNSIHQTGLLIALLEELKYRGCGVRTATNTVFVEMMADNI